MEKESSGSNTLEVGGVSCRGGYTSGLRHSLNKNEQILSQSFRILHILTQIEHSSD